MGTRRSTAGFTLVELLVSMAVLVLLISAVVAMVDGVSATTTSQRRHLASDNEARRVFDRMAFDFERMLKRADADAVFASIKGPDASHGANDKLFFYSDAPAYYDTSSQPNPAPAQSTAGLIGYRVPNDSADASVTTSRWQLERLGKGLTWDLASAASTPGAVVFLTYPAASPSPAPTPTPFPASTLAGAWPGTLGTAANHYDDGVDANYHVLSADVFRLEFCFVLKNATAGNLYTTSLTPGQGFSNVSAIIVGLALLDAPGRARLPAGTSMNTLAAALPDPDFTTNPRQLMAERWAATLNTPGLAATLGVSQSVISQIHVYERTFILNTP